MRNKLVLLAYIVISSNGQANERSLIICLPLNPRIDDVTVFRAKDYATRIYHSIGVELRWKPTCAANERDAPGTRSVRNLKTIAIEWADRAPDSVSTQAFASARPFQPTGTRIT